MEATQARETLLADAHAFHRRATELIERKAKRNALTQSLPPRPADPPSEEVPSDAGGASATWSGAGGGGERVEAVQRGKSGIIGMEGTVRLKAEQVLVDWVGSIGLSQSVASHLLPLAGGDGTVVMDGVAGLTEGDVRGMVQGMKDALAGCLWSGVQKLKADRAQETQHASVDELRQDNDKFTGEASYGDTQDFFSGLDGRIGLPSTRPLDGMRDEHCHAADSRDEFVTSNYGGTRTFPAQEWEAVFSPSPGSHYPGKDRSIAPIQEFLDKPEAKQAQLTLVECCALRLYTGPMYMKYNTVLRRGPAPALDALKGNAYATTLHAIVSGVIKLSKVWSIPPSRRVYRGIAGLRLPRTFWEPDAHGCCGGVELGLMSTTTKKEVATHYSKSIDGKLATLIEIEVGQIDRGASLVFLSQYPSEEEILLPPLSNLEVIGKPRISVSGGGSIVVLPCRVSCNLKSLTMDELLERRKKQMISMQMSLMQEVRRNIGGRVWGGGSEFVVTVLGDFEKLRQETEETEAVRFNEDVFYRDMVNRSLNLKVGTERKWQLLHDEEVLSTKGLRERVLNGLAGKFSDEGFIYELRSGTDKIPFSSIIKGDLSVNLVPCLDPGQSAIMWECVVKHCPEKGVTVPDEAGNHYAAADGLQGDTAKIACKKVDPRQVCTLSAGFRHFPSLTCIKLPDTFLRDSGATSLAKNLSHCPWLLSLDIGENAIGPPGCRAMSDVLSTSCTQLTSFRLSWNPVGAAGFSELSGLFRCCTRLTNLDACLCLPSDDGMVSFAESLGSSSLTSLEIGFNMAHEGRGAAALAGVLSANTSLTRLDVWNLLSGKEQVLGSLQVHTSLTSLVLFDMTSESMECQQLMSSFVGRNPRLSSILLKHDSEHIARALDTSGASLVRYVAIGGWPTSPGSLAPLSRVLCRDTMRYLNSTDEIVEGGWFSMTPLLEESYRAGLTLNPNMESISIQGSGQNFAKVEHMNMLAAYTKRCKHLSVLVIRGCGVTSEGGLALEGLLAANSESLTSLDLTHNALGGEWSKRMAPQIAECHCLRELKISHNKLGVEGLFDIVGGVKGLSALTKLDLVHNEQGTYPMFLQGHSLEPLAQLRSVTSLTHLSLGGGLMEDAVHFRVSKTMANLAPEVMVSNGWMEFWNPRKSLDPSRS